MRLYPPHVLQIFVRNRCQEGMTGAQIADWLRRELHWHTLDPDTFDDFGKRQYRQVAEYLQELEGRADTT